MISKLIMLDKKKSIIFALLLTLIAIISLFYIMSFQNSQSNDISLLESSTPVKEENLCGPFSLFIACNRLGYQKGFKEISEGLNITTQGVSFGNLSSYSKSLGFNPQLTRLNWEDLKQIDTTVILWVDGNHFLTADPRESDPKELARIRIYEHGCPAKWYSREKLSKRWAGETLVLRKNKTPLAANTDNSKIQINTFVQDCGFSRPEKVEKFVYNIKNIGQKPLNVSIAQTGCGCARAVAEPNVIEPGSQGVISMFVDLKEKRGIFSTFAKVKTDDPKLPQFHLIASGGVYQPEITSLDKIYFGEIHRNKKYIKVFYLHDRGDKNLRILSDNILIDDTMKDFIVCSSKIEKLNANNIPKNPSSRMKIKKGDLLYSLVVEVLPEAPLGLFEGKISINTNQPDEFKTAFVFFKGEIKDDYYTQPSTVMLSSKKPSVDVSIFQVNKKVVEIASLDSTINNLEVAEVAGEENRIYRLSINGSVNKVVNGKVTFTTDTGTNINVPVIIIPSS